MYIHQAIQHPQGVTAFGSHTIGVEPDRAVVAYSVARIAQAPEEAFEQVEMGRATVGSVLDHFNIAPNAVTVSRTSIELAAEGYGDNRKVLGYRAQLDYSVVVNDLSCVTTFVTALVKAGARAIHSVTYTTSRLRELRRTARERAFESAQVKADAYARAAGLKVGRALHIEDVDPSSLKSGGHGRDIDLGQHDEVANAPAGSVTVAGAVLVCFALVDA
jgi:uncharacterized protein YggE